jgi:hypothetical protein
MPAKAHLDIGWDAARVWPDPRLVWAESDPDLAGAGASFVAGRLIVVQSASMSSYE